MTENEQLIDAAKKISEILQNKEMDPYEVIKMLQQRIKVASINIRIAQIGSCTCMTKTPDPAYHHATCIYKQLMDISEILNEKK